MKKSAITPNLELEYQKNILVMDSILIRESIKILVKKLKDAGNSVDEVSLPNTHLTIAAYYVLTTVKAASNLSRYDGVRYGKRSHEETSLGSMYAGTRSKGFGKEVKRRIMLGNYVLSGGYYDAYFNKAQKVRRLIKSDFSLVFKDYDLILTPVTPSYHSNLVKCWITHSPCILEIFIPHR